MYSVQGMTCEGCAITLREALIRSPGVTTADVSYERKMATVGFDAAPTRDADEAVAVAARGAGYAAEPAP